MKYLNSKSDPAFWLMFGKHPDLIISLLNALLPLAPEQEITEIEYLPFEMIPENPWRKNSIIDVGCKDKLGCRFIVEIQIN